MLKRPWADQPFPLIPTPTGPSIKDISPQTLKVASEMCLAHNLFIRTLNAIYLQAPNLTLPTDISDFILFCQFWHETISLHHEHEESLFFPWIEEYTKEQNIMEGNVSQHAAFHDGLEAFGSFVKSVKVEEWDSGRKLLGIIDGFSEALMVHLREEIESLLALERFGGENLGRVWERLEKMMQAEVTDKSKVIPMGLGGIDRTFEGGKFKDWPPFPWFIPYVVRLFFMGKYKGVWRFSPCTIFGQPKELPFVKHEQ